LPSLRVLALRQSRTSHAKRQALEKLALARSGGAGHMSYWTVAQTESSREHIAKLFLDQQGFETYLPKVKLRKQVVPMFPGYLFVRIEDVWHRINATIGVVCLLPVRERPGRIPDDFINGFRSEEDRNGLIRLPKNNLQRGEKVRIMRGTFAEQVGLFEGQSGRDRVCVLLSLFNCLTKVELRPTDVQRI
jgi:transcriptional antiterminator RfaH